MEKIDRHNPKIKLIEAWQMTVPGCFTWWNPLKKRDATEMIADGFDDEGFLRFHSLRFPELRGRLSPRQFIMIGEIGSHHDEKSRYKTMQKLSNGQY